MNAYNPSKFNDFIYRLIYSIIEVCMLRGDFDREPKSQNQNQNLKQEASIEPTHIDGMKI